MLFSINISLAAGMFNANMFDDVQTIDPLSFFGLPTHNVLSQIYEGFTAIDSQGHVTPALATSWQTPDGGLTWHITLRRGVLFHSGREFTSDDVKWTFTQLLKPRPRPSLSSFQLQKVVGAQHFQTSDGEHLAGVSAPDRYTVDIRLSEPDVLFPIKSFFIVDSGIVAEVGSDWASHMSAGTGPYQVRTWRRGQELLLRAHHDYWGGPPLSEVVRFAVIPSGEKTLAAFDAGELDLVTLAGTVARNALINSKYSSQLHAYAKSQIFYLGLNQALYLFSIP